MLIVPVNKILKRRTCFCMYRITPAFLPATTLRKNRRFTSFFRQQQKPIELTPVSLATSLTPHLATSCGRFRRPETLEDSSNPNPRYHLAQLIEKKFILI
ncbi:hypothetical protein CDAR_74011 [Caerostris darwini]|uniref:Uncharacterized protein n=1 Tax=Caerostris darwini TaxID=1538125 RepID=A0AAV4MSQ1_9ARAC|nr:hypothetical protein CDAR_74011 [Caerostris darwini]